MENKALEGHSFVPREIYKITLSFMVPLFLLAMISFAIDIGTVLSNVSCGLLVISLINNIQFKIWKGSKNGNEKWEKFHWYLFLWFQFAGYILLATSFIFR